MIVAPYSKLVEVQVRPFTARTLKEPDEAYDIVLATLGYEERARAIAQAVGSASHLAACGFDSHRALSYEENRAWFSDNGFLVVEPGDTNYRAWLNTWLSEAVASAGTTAGDVATPIRVAIDVSSMTRSRIAYALETALQLGERHPLAVDFLYTPALYRDPPEEPDFTASIEPVTPFFRGWPPDPMRPAAALIGLGYEIDKAAGAKEYLELKDIWAFMAEGDDPLYAEKVRENNELLWDEIESERVVQYAISDPYGLFVQLESQLFGMLRQGRALVLPMGPKIFALVSMVAALHHHPEVGVWRVRQLETPVQRVSNGQLYGLRVLLGSAVENRTAMRGHKPG
jgi:hypothetical protein